MNNITTHKQSLKYIVIALCLTLLLMFIQATAAYYANSLALFADSSHMLVHNSSLIIALISSFISFKLSKNNLHKAAIVDLIGGFLNSLIFLSIAFCIFSEGFHRIHQHSDLEVNPIIMGVVSIAGLCIHSLAAYILSKGKKYSFNVQALFFHTFIDCISTIFTFTASLLILFTDFKHIDAIASMTIACLVSYAGFKLIIKCVKKSLVLKKESKLARKITKYLKDCIKEIYDIHNVAIELQGSEIKYSAHIVLNKEYEKEYLEIYMNKIIDSLNKEFKINAPIIQLEHNK